MPTSRFSRPQPCSFRPSADLAGRPVAILPDVPTCFDEPLAEHHKLIGRWVASRETSARRYARPEVRARIEQVFDTAVMEVLEPIDLADFTVAVLHSEEEGPPAIALVCRDMGQIDLGWIGADDVPVAWSAAAYTALELTLGRVLPAFTYAEFFEEFAVCHWEGETDDEAARQCLVDYHGMDPDDVDNLTLPSTLDAKRPAWMLEENAARAAQLPRPLRRALRELQQAHRTVTRVPCECDAWHFAWDVVQEYLPGFDERARLPPMTLVPMNIFARELDDITHYGMELGFMDVAGLLPLPDAARIDDWFASLKQGVRFLLAAQHLIRLDPKTF